MRIKGVQKFSLIDYPDKLSCTVFLFGCNFRCGFCHNPELVLTPSEFEFSKQWLLDFLDKRKGQLDAVCFSGGEPLMTLEPELVKKVKAKGYLVKIDTNGSYPEQLKKLIDEKLLDFVSMDIKASRDNYEKVCGAKADISKIEESIRMISGLPSYEFRTTIVKKYHDKAEVVKILKWLNSIAGGKVKRYVLQGFKKEDKLLDDSFRKCPDVDEKYLLEIKEAIKDFADEIVIRV